MRRQIGRMVDIDGRPVHVRQDGDPGAPAIVLVHGFTASLHWWDGVCAALSGNFYIVRLDLAGHGCTSGATGLDIEAQAGLVVGVLDTLGMTAATGVGHSFGADVVLAAAKQSSSIAKLVIVNQAPDYSYANFPPGATHPLTSLVAARIHRLVPPALVRSGMRIGFAPEYNSSNRQFVRDHAAMAPEMYRVVLADRSRRLALHPLDEQVRSLGLPTLAVHGKHDRMYDCERTLSRYAAAGAATVVIEAAGHSPNVETPLELADIVAAFVGIGQAEAAL